MNKELKELVRKSRHKAELPVTAVFVIISLAMYAAVAYFGIIAPSLPEGVEKLAEMLEYASVLAKCGKYIVIAFVGITLVRIVWAYFRDIGAAFARDVRISEKQSKEVYDIYNSLVERMHYTAPPTLSLSKENSDMTVLGVPIKNYYCIRMNEVQVFNAHDYGDDYSKVKFLIASELAHTVLGHKDVLLFILTYPARVIPVFNNLLDHFQTYSSDRVAAELMDEEEIVRAITWDENDIDYAGWCLDGSKYEKSLNDGINAYFRFGRFIENLSSDTPVPIYRLYAVREYYRQKRASEEKNEK